MMGRHMYTVFSLFPDLFSLAILATAILRIVAGVYFLVLGVQFFTQVRNNIRLTTYARVYGLVLSGMQVLVGILLVIGLYTQGAALAAILVSLLVRNVATRLGVTRIPYSTYTLLAVITFCLLFLGPGAFAVDLPL